MKGFSWFSREQGKGNLLDPLGLLSSQKSQKSVDRLAGQMGFGNQNPLLRIGRGESLQNIGIDMTNPSAFRGQAADQKNQSVDQKIGMYTDPGNFFGKKEESSYFGPSRLEGNLSRYEQEKYKPTSRSTYSYLSGKGSY